MRWGLASVALVGACFTPRPQPGSPCAANGECPGDLVCNPTTATCELSTFDAGVTFMDARPDAAPPTADARLCFGSGVAQICPTVMPSTPFTVDTPLAIDTNTSTACIAYTGATPNAFCVVAGTTQTLAGAVSPPPT